VKNLKKKKNDKTKKQQSQEIKTAKREMESEEKTVI